VKRVVIDWLPVALWAAVILHASGPSFDGNHTGSIIERVFAAIGLPLSITAAELVNTIVRKLAHLTEYAILGTLAFRGARSDRRGWTAAWSVTAVVIATAVATSDELLQSFTPTRTATPADVLLDATGATIAQLVIRRVIEYVG
jgi:VanZ family protein